MGGNRLGSVAKCISNSGKYTNPRSNISSLSRALLPRVERANNLLGESAIGKSLYAASASCFEVWLLCMDTKITQHLACE
jgi:hypothetical protein